MRKWLINALGGYTAKQLEDSNEINRQKTYEYFLGIRRHDLVNDRTLAIQNKRKVSDINKKLALVVGELVSIDDARA